ncbi:46012_t:CDS:2, partial [Gigaspora margarita]
IQHFRVWRHNLSLMPIYSKTVNISTKKTLSNSKYAKDTYYLSINDIIWHVLNNPSLIKYMYFGPGQEVTNKSEYWQGNLWAESPRYGQDSIEINKFIKLFLDLYYDNFGTYRNVYYSLGEIYLQFGNLPMFMRKLLKNHFILGFVPFGETFNDFIKPFIAEMKSLECGQIINIQGQDYWVIVGLGVVIADLLQGNDLAGVKRHGANKDCLPNFHNNTHLVLYAQTYRNLIKTVVGTKEMVHQIFKKMVLRTNCKNIELDLLKRYTTLFAIGHLIDGGIDARSLCPNQVFQENELDDDEGKFLMNY